MIVRSSSAVPFAVEDLVVAYRAEPVLWNVTWSARAGAMSAIVGPNGAGKSSLLNAAVGLVPTVNGRVSFWGMSFRSMRSRIAYVPQRESIDWDFPITALQVVEMGITQGADWLIPDLLKEPLRGLRAVLGGARRGDAATSTERAALQALERVGMESFARRPIGELSGGQQQRVFLARALAQDADLYLMDEPFAGVDVTTEEILSTQLRALCDQGKTVVAVHHDLDDVANRFDEVAVLNRELIASGPTRATLNLEAVRQAFHLPAESAAEALTGAAATSSATSPSGPTKGPDLAASRAGD